jgi:hypothetical protein
MHSTLLRRLFVATIFTPACLMAQQWEIGAAGGFGWYADATINNTAGSTQAGLKPSFAFGVTFDQDMYTYIGGELHYTLIPQYAYKTETPKVSFSSSFLAPVNWVGVTASTQLNDLSRRGKNANVGLADVIFTPLTVGIHFSDTNNLAISTMIFAPTGAFTAGNLSNLGMNEWTIMPNVAHTILWEKRGLELDKFHRLRHLRTGPDDQVHQRHYVPLGRHARTVPLKEVWIWRDRFQPNADQ